MAKSKLICAMGTSVIAADRYFHVTGRFSGTAITTESDAQITFNQGGIISNLGVNITANTTTACDFYVRQNLANSTIVVSYTSGQTGIKEDLTNTITVAAGDEINYFADVTSGTSITGNSISCTFNSTTDTYQIFCSNNTPTGQDDALTRYYYFNSITAQVTETDAQCEMLIPGIFKHFFVNVTANTHTTAASDFFLSVNASTSGCPTVNYAATQTGFKEDMSTTKAVVDADDCTFKCVTAANAGTTTITFSTISCGFYINTGKFQASVLSSGINYAFNQTNYHSIHGFGTTGNTESQRELTLSNGDNNVTELLVEVSANTIATSASTIDYRKNLGGNTLQVSFAATITGTKSTIGGTRVGVGDEVDYRVVTPNTSGTLTIQQISSLYEIMPRFYPLNKFNFNDIDEGEEIG